MNARICAFTIGLAAGFAATGFPAGATDGAGALVEAGTAAGTGAGAVVEVIGAAAGVAEAGRRRAGVTTAAVVRLSTRRPVRVRVRGMSISSPCT